MAGQRRACPAISSRVAYAREYRAWTTCHAYAGCRACSGTPEIPRPLRSRVRQTPSDRFACGVSHEPSGTNLTVVFSEDWYICRRRAWVTMAGTRRHRDRAGTVFGEALGQRRTPHPNARRTAHRRAGLLRGIGAAARSHVAPGDHPRQSRRCRRRLAGAPRISVGRASNAPAARQPVRGHGRVRHGAGGERSGR